MNNKFLAITALEEFWDLSKELIFLHRGCLRLQQEELLKQPYQILESPWQNQESLIAAREYVDLLYEDLLTGLAVKLNSLHQVKYTVRYWRIVLGPWLHTYIAILYDRYVTLEQALEKYPDVETIGLSQECFIQPKDTNDFINLLKTDHYNLQLYTKLLEVLGKKIRKQFLAQRNDEIQQKKVSLKVKLHFLAGRFLTKFIVNKHSLVINSVYFPRSVLKQLLLRSKGKIVPISGVTYQASSIITLAKGMREQLKTALSLKNQDRFAECLITFISEDIPAIFIENYKSLNNYVKRYYPSKPKAIFSANAWHYNESFKWWAAQAVEQGVLLLGTQHGGNYGVVDYLPAQQHETSIVDRYYTWGWRYPCYQSQVIPMPAAKLMAINHKSSNLPHQEILWGSTAFSRYLVNFYALPEQFFEYLKWQERFLKALDQPIKSFLRFRPHYEDLGWNITERIKRIEPAIKVESWSAPFLESLANCRLYVCDHLSTTYTEALTANKPTLLFWDPSVNIYHNSAVFIFDALKRANILHETPESAASFLSKISNHIEDWWHSAECQSARRLFCDHFARQSDTALKEWLTELTRIISA